MSFLEDLTLDQREMIVSLPYRAGLWVSYSDETGGGEADEREAQVLSNIIHAYAEDVFGAEVLQYIISETLLRKEEWKKWSQNISSVPKECAQALHILHEHLDEKDISAFKIQILEIGEAVALAFREEVPLESFADKFKLYKSYAAFSLKNMRDKRRRKSFDEFLRISPSEREALSVLARALETIY